MVQTTFITLFFLLLAPSLVVPNNMLLKNLWNVTPTGSALPSVLRARLPPHPTSPRLANLLRAYPLREDAEEISQRDPESIGSLITRDDEFQFTERGIEDSKDLSARGFPNWVNSQVGSAIRFVNKVGKAAAKVPGGVVKAVQKASNITKVGKVY